MALCRQVDDRVCRGRVAGLVLGLAASVVAIGLLYW